MSLPNILFESSIMGYITECGEEGGTIKEIAASCRGNYYTTRNYVLALVKDQRLEQAPFVRDKAAVYRLPDASLTPKIRTSKGDKTMLTNYALSSLALLDIEKDFLAVRAALASMYYEAAQGRPGGAEVTKHLRGSILKAKKSAEIMAENMGMLLNIDRLYTAQGQQDMILDPDHGLRDTVIATAAQNAITNIKELIIKAGEIK